MESLYLMDVDANNLHGWAMSEKLPINGFKWRINVSNFDGDFIKVMMKIVVKDTSLR